MIVLKLDNDASFIEVRIFCACSVSFEEVLESPLTYYHDVIVVYN